MRHLFILILTTIIYQLSFAQLPAGINYQAIARNADGEVLKLRNVTVRLSIKDGGVTGTDVYTEVHKIQTNRFGLFAIAIGKGVAENGQFNQIDWSSGNKWIQVEMDPNGGQQFALMGVSELLSVPYALYAAEAGNAKQDLLSLFYDATNDELLVLQENDSLKVMLPVEKDNLTDNVLNDMGDVNVSPSPGQVLKWNGTHWIASDEAQNYQSLSIINHQLAISGSNSIDLSTYLDNTDEQQLTFNTTTNTLTLSNGGAVDLSSLIGDADADPLNELQTLSINGQELSLSGSNTSVMLPSANLSGTDYFLPRFAVGGQSVENSQVFDNGVNVGIGTSSPAAKLDVRSASMGLTGLTVTANNHYPMYFNTGSAIAATGADIGVAGFAKTYTGSAYGGYFFNDGIYAYVGGWELANSMFTPYKIIGNGAVSTIVENTKGEAVTMFATEAPEVLFQDYGTGSLVNGKARITIDPDFSKNILVNDDHPLKVFVQLEGDCNGVYVTGKSATGFEVKELQNGTSNVPFSWTVVATRKNMEVRSENGEMKTARFDVRFPKAPGPKQYVEKK